MTASQPAAFTYRDLRRALDRKTWTQLREAVYAAWQTLEYLAAGHGGPADAARTLDGLRIILGRGWNGHSIHRDPAEPPPDPEVYRRPAAAPQDSYDAWMAARRAGRVAITGEDLQAQWEAALAARHFLRLLDTNETDEVLTMMTELWQQATAPEPAAPG